MVPLTLVPVWALRTGLDYQARMYEHYYETVSALSLMLQRAHPYTHGHLERVAADAEEVAARLGLSPERARLVREAAVLSLVFTPSLNRVIASRVQASGLFVTWSVVLFIMHVLTWRVGASQLDLSDLQLLSYRDARCRSTRSKKP